MIEDATIEECEAKAPPLALDGSLRLACYSIRAVALIWWLWSSALALWIWSDRETTIGRWVKLYDLDPASVGAVGYSWASLVIVAIASVAAVMVYFLWRLTRSYLDGRVFSVEAAGHLRRVALAGFATVAAGVAGRPIQVAMISSSLFAKLPFYAWFGPPDLLYLVICGFLLALGVIFEAAAEIAEDHAKIV